jgi:hypothetical protein
MRTIGKQRGVTTVEFAIIGAVALLVLFAVIEVSRAVYAMNALNESTRRAARFAAVCPIGDAAINEVAVFNAPGGGNVSPVLTGFGSGNVLVEYLDENGTVLGAPAGGDFLNIRFVRASIVNYTHQMLIPFGNWIIPSPDFATTLRRESLGIPRDGVVTPC